MSGCKPGPCPRSGCRGQGNRFCASGCSYDSGRYVPGYWKPLTSCALPGRHSDFSPHSDALRAVHSSAHRLANCVGRWVLARAATRYSTLNSAKTYASGLILIEIPLGAWWNWWILARCWSRRITEEHRWVYRVSGDSVDSPPGALPLLAISDPAAIRISALRSGPSGRP